MFVCPFFLSPDKVPLFMMLGKYYACLLRIAWTTLYQNFAVYMYMYMHNMYSSSAVYVPACIMTLYVPTVSYMYVAAFV
jgi:hypothetical protein